MKNNNINKICAGIISFLAFSEIGFAAPKPAQQGASTLVIPLTSANGTLHPLHPFPLHPFPLHPFPLHPFPLHPLLPTATPSTAQQGAPAPRPPEVDASKDTSTGESGPSDTHKKGMPWTVQEMETALSVIINVKGNSVKKTAKSIQNALGNSRAEAACVNKLTGINKVFKEDQTLHDRAIALFDLGQSLENLPDLENARKEYVTLVLEASNKIRNKENRDHKNKLNAMIPQVNEGTSQVNEKKRTLSPEETLTTVETVLTVKLRLGKVTTNWPKIFSSPEYQQSKIKSDPSTVQWNYQRSDEAFKAQTGKSFFEYVGEEIERTGQTLEEVLAAPVPGFGKPPTELARERLKDYWKAAKQLQRAKKTQAQADA